MPEVGPKNRFPTPGGGHAHTRRWRRHRWPVRGSRLGRNRGAAWRPWEPSRGSRRGRPRRARPKRWPPPWRRGWWGGVPRGGETALSDIAYRRRRNPWFVSFREIEFRTQTAEIPGGLCVG